ncbi:MAG: Ig-like domain-containing protein [Chloroflexota bacterium]
MKHLLFVFLLLAFLAGGGVPAASEPAQAGPQAAVQPFLVKDINPSTVWDASTVRNLVLFDDRLFFTASDGLHGISLWQSNGTAAGTLIFKDFDENISYAPSSLTVLNDKLFFSVASKTNGKEERNELWWSDGTVNGTARIKQFYPGQGVALTSLAAVDSLLFFLVIIPPPPDEKGQTYELWRSDGTAAGTIWLGDFSSLREPANMNGKLYFVGTSKISNESGLWISNGTPSGTIILKKPSGGYTSVVSPARLAYLNDTVFFFAKDDTYGVEIWKTRGTVASIERVTNIDPGIGSGATGSLLTPCNGLLFFTAADSQTGYELWVTSGTGLSTKRVKDIYPGTTGSFPSYAFCLDGKLIFRANGSGGKTALWRSDGMEAGTVRIKDVEPVGYLSVFTASHGLYFFTVMDVNRGTPDLWKSDGTEAGTVRVSEGVPAVNSRTVTSPPFVVANDILFFTGSDQAHGLELWGLSLQDLAIGQQVTPQAPVAPGQVVTYTLSFRNDGHIPAAGVTIRDAFPAQLENITWQGSGVAVTLTGTDPHTWQVAEIKPGQGGAITVQATLRRGYAAGVTFTNTATLANSTNEADKANNSSSAVVTVANLAPSANDDSLNADNAGENVLDVLANDTDPNADALTVAAVSEPLHGTAAADGARVRYTPPKGYVGKDTFNYTVSDGHGGTDTASVLVHVFAATYNAFLPLGIREWPPVVLLDDAPDLCREAYAVTSFEKTYRDDFDKEVDPDWYRFEAVRGTDYTVDVTAGAGATPVLRLYDSECQYLDLQGVPDGSHRTRLRWTHGWASGTYYWLIYEAYGRYGSGTDYQLAVEASQP